LLGFPDDARIVGAERRPHIRRTRWRERWWRGTGSNRLADDVEQARGSGAREERRRTVALVDQLQIDDQRSAGAVDDSRVMAAGNHARAERPPGNPAHAGQRVEIDRQRETG